MVHPSILKFYLLLASFDTDIVFELQNCNPNLELVKYSSFDGNFTNEFSDNSLVKYCDLDETAFIIFKPTTFDYGTPTYIAVDSSGKIYKLIFKSGPKYIKEEIANDIFQLIKSSKISIQKLPKVYSFINYDFPKFSYDERFEFDYIQSIIRNTLLKNPLVSNFNSSIISSDESTIRTLKLNFNAAQRVIDLNIDNSQFREGSDSLMQFINTINQELIKIDAQCKFVVVHENEWGSLHALLLVDLETYNKLEHNNLIINY